MSFHPLLNLPDSCHVVLFLSRSGGNSSLVILQSQNMLKVFDMIDNCLSLNHIIILTFFNCSPANHN